MMRAFCVAFVVVVAVLAFALPASAHSKNKDQPLRSIAGKGCSPFKIWNKIVDPNRWNVLSGIQEDGNEQKNVFFEFSLCEPIVIPNAAFGSTPTYVAVNPFGAKGIPPFYFDRLMLAIYDPTVNVYRLRYGSSAAHHINDVAEVAVQCGGSSPNISFAGPSFYPSRNANGGMTAKFTLVSAALCLHPAPPPPPITSVPTPPPTAIPANGTAVSVLGGRLTLEYAWAGESIEWTLSSPAQAGRYFAVAKSWQGMSHGLGVACEQPAAAAAGGGGALAAAGVVSCTPLATHEWGVRSRADDSLTVVSASAVNGGQAVVKVRLSASGMNVTSGLHRIIYAIGQWNATSNLPLEHAFHDRNYGEIIFRQQ